MQPSDGVQDAGSAGGAARRGEKTLAELAFYNARIDVYDSCVDRDEASHEYGISPIAEPKPVHHDAIVIAVGRGQFAEMGSRKFRALGKPSRAPYDIKYLLGPH